MEVSSPTSPLSSRTTLPPTHIAFADESGYNVGRYRALGVVSLRYSSLAVVNTQLGQILTESGMSEFKWKKLGGAKERFAAQKLLKFAVEQATFSALRFDVLIWDTYDNRHDIRGRDDIANLHRMYHHLFKSVMRQRWPGNSTWVLRPDHHTAMQWSEVQQFLEKVSHHVNHTPSLFKPWMSADLQRQFSIQEISPCDSKQEPLVQLIDLITGLAVYSRTNYEKYQHWQPKELTLFSMDEDQDPPPQLCRADKERCVVLDEFNSLCKQRKLGVSLTQNKGLRTLKPSNPINFWWYIPQHSDDKAPTRRKAQ